MKEVKGNQNVTASQMHVIAVAWILFTLLFLTGLTVVFWDQICGRIVLNALEYGARQLAAPKRTTARQSTPARQATYYQPQPSQQSTNAFIVEHQREFEEWLDAQPPVNRTWEEAERWAEKMMRESPHIYDVNE